MPIASLIAAASRIASLALSGARNAATTGFALSRRVAEAGRRLISSANRAARATYRAFTQRARNLARRASALGDQLWRSLVNALRELRLAALRILRAVRRIFRSPSEPPEPNEDDIRKIARRYPGAKSAIEALQEALQDERLMQRLSELLLQDEREMDELSIGSMSEAYQAEVRALLEELEAQGETIDEEVALEQFYERAAPYVLAARLAAGDDPTVLDDMDIEEHLAQLGEDFVETLSQEAPARVLARSTTSLFGAVKESYRRARMRLAMASNLATSVNADEFIPFATVQEVAQRNAREAEELAQAFDSAKRGQFGIAGLLERLSDFVAGVICALPEALGLFRRGAEDEREQREEREEPDGRERDEEDDETIYGVWRVNCTRVTQRHCSDCLALEALTALGPVPIENLPTPGTETQCGSECACCIDEVSASEAEQFSRIYWQGAPYFLSQEQIDELLSSRSEDAMRLALARMQPDVSARLRKWLETIDLSADVPHART